MLHEHAAALIFALIALSLRALLPLLVTALRVHVRVDRFRSALDLVPVLVPVLVRVHVHQLVVHHVTHFRYQPASVVLVV